MKSHRLILPFIAALALLTTASYASSDDQAVVHVLETITHAVENHDLASVDQLWIKDETFAIIDNGDASYGDWKSFSHDLTLELAPMRDIVFALLNVRPHVIGQLAWITYEYRFHAQGKDGPIANEGAGTLVLRRTNHAWMATHMHLSTKRPAEIHDAAPGHQH